MMMQLLVTMWMIPGILGVHPNDNFVLSDEEYWKRATGQHQPFHDSPWVSDVLAPLALSQADRRLTLGARRALHRDMVSVADLQLLSQQQEEELLSERASRNIGILHQDLEIFPPQFYFLLENARLGHQQENFFERFRSTPLKHMVLWEAEKTSVVSTLASSAYHQWIISEQRPEGLDSTMNCFVDEVRLLFRYHPAGLTAKGPLRAEGKLIGGDPGWDRETFEPIRNKLTSALMIEAESHVLAIQKKYNLDADDLERYGVQYIVRTRFDWICTQLRNPVTGKMTTRSMLAANAQLAPYLPDARALHRAERLATTRPGFRGSRFKPLEKTIVTDFVPLPVSGWIGLGIIGDGLVPMGGEPSSTKSYSMGFNLASSFQLYAANMAQSLEALNRQELRHRPALKSELHFLNILPTVIRKPFETPKLLMDFFKLRGFLGNRKSRKEVPFDPHCTEPGLYGNFEILTEVCIITPHPYTSFAVDERFMTQCLGIYPIGSLAFVGATTKERIVKKEASLMHLAICKREGWRPVTHVDADPYDLLRVCSMAKDRGTHDSFLTGTRVQKALNKTRLHWGLEGSDLHSWPKTLQQEYLENLFGQ